MICSKCGLINKDDAVFCAHCGNNINDNNAARVNDKISVGLIILSVFVPLFGIIYWAVKHKETPKRARTCGIFAIVSWIISFIITMISMSDILYFLIY